MNRFVYRDKKIFNNEKEMFILRIYVKNINYFESKIFYFNICNKFFFY